MFERYTEQARRVLFFARYEVSQLGGLSIEVDHVLLGLIRERKGVTRKLFERARVSPEEIRQAIEARTVFRERVSTSVETPFAPETKRVLQFAAEEADRLEHRHIGTEHLLLAILREEQTAAAPILTARGMGLISARQDVADLGNEQTPPLRSARHESAFEPPPHLEIRIAPTERHAHAEPFASAGPVYWLAHGFTFRGLIAQVCEVDESRIDCPATDNLRYDCTVVVPRQDEPDAIRSLAREAIERFFTVSVKVERGPDGPRVLVVPGGR
jgi:hypothetical protein